MVDIDECIEWTFKCHDSQQCQNTYGSYECVCEDGLYWVENQCKGETDMLRC